MQDHRTALEKEQDELEALVSLVYATAEGTDERATAIQNLQKQYPDFLKNLGDEKTSNENLRTALKETNDEYFKKIKLQSQSKELTKLPAASVTLLISIFSVIWAWVPS